MAANRRTAPERERRRAGDAGAGRTPGKDLAGAILIGAVAVAVMLASLELEVPDTRLTAPGLLPLITSLALLAMAAALALRAVRAGALAHLGSEMAAAAGAYCSSAAERRAWLLAALVLGYVVLVARLGFELPVPFTGLAVSGYEVVSVIVVTVLLKLFWRAGLARCLIVALVSVELLALAFRYGFNLIMPEAF